MKETISFDERLKGQGGPGGVDSLEVLAQRPPFFFQGVAALTGMRCQRENLECWSRWDAAFYQMQRKDKNRRLCRKFLFWLIWGGQDLIKDNDEEAISHLLLEPMYWLEESACTQKGAL